MTSAFRYAMRKLTVLIVTLVTSTALAHDFWIEPSEFRPKVGTNLTASLRVGMEFIGDPVARDSSMIERFVVRDGAGERDIPGLERQDPAGYVRVDSSGIAIIGYRSRPKYLEMPADKFEAYLKDEGLESIIASRARSGDSLKPSKEIYSRCAKAILLAEGDAPGPGARFDTPLAFRYEIVPQTNPYQTKGDDLHVVVLYEGKPLANALVVAMHRDDSSLRLRLRSDRKGRVTFHLPKRGVWLIKSVQMIPAPAGSNADWESLWASLTFER